MRLPDLFTNFSQHSAGIDLCGEQIRFVQLRRHQKGYEISTFGSIKKSDTAFALTDILNTERAAHDLRNGLSSFTHTIRAAYVSIPERHSFLKLLAVPSTTGTSLDESVRWETTQHIPYELKDLTIDWMKVPTKDTSRTSALVAACPTQVSNAYRALIEKSGLLLFGLEPASVALVRAHQHHFSQDATCMLLSIGELESMAIVLNNGLPCFAASLPFTVSSIVAMLMKRFSMTHHDAQKSLYAFGFYKLRARGLVRDALKDTIDQLTKRIHDIDDFSQTHFNGMRALSEIRVCGPGASIAGFLDELSSRMKLSTPLATPMPGLTYSRHANDFPRVSQEYAVALGLAMNLVDAH